MDSVGQILKAIKGHVDKQFEHLEFIEHEPPNQPVSEKTSREKDEDEFFVGRARSGGNFQQSLFNALGPSTSAGQNN